MYANLVGKLLSGAIRISPYISALDATILDGLSLAFPYMIREELPVIRQVDAEGQLPDGVTHSRSSLDRIS
jgi:hypothetical protein